MAIVKPENMDFSDKTFSMIIYGSPGIGKTTLALSAPDPILLDFDRGISRVKSAHRRPTEFFFTKQIKQMIDAGKNAAQVADILRTKYGVDFSVEDVTRMYSYKSQYEEVLYDLKHSEDIRKCKTIVLDTGGSLVTFLKEWAMEEKGAKTKSGEFNSLKGFGFVKTEWNSLTEYIKTTLRKNAIFVFHSNEEKDKDGNPIQRLVCEGSARNIVWTPCDFGGYMQMIDNRRAICFTPEQEFFAKGCHGIVGRIPVPELKDDTKNDFVTRLFEKAKANIDAEAAEFAPVKEKYSMTMETVRTIIDGVTDLESANTALQVLPDLDHALTSKKEASAMLMTKTKQLGLKYDQASGSFVKPEENPEEGGA